MATICLITLKLSAPETKLKNSFSALKNRMMSEREIERWSNFVFTLREKVFTKKNQLPLFLTHDEKRELNVCSHI